MKKNFIGVEKKKFYIKIANEKIKKIKTTDE